MLFHRRGFCGLARLFVTFGGSVWVRARAASSNLKETVSSVPAWFRADSGTNLIKQGEIVTGRSSGSVAQW